MVVVTSSHKTGLLQPTTILPEHTNIFVLLDIIRTSVCYKNIMNGTLNFLRGMNLYTTFCKTDIKKLLTTLQNAYSSLFKTDFPQVMQTTTTTTV